MQITKDFQIGQRTYVGGGEQSFGTVTEIEPSYGVFVKLDSDGEIVFCSPLMLSTDGETPYQADQFRKLSQ